MNCANHSQTPAAAYCRTCGKPLCTACTRQVMGVIYCENCLAERVAGTSPPQTQTPPQQAGLRYQAGVQPVGAGPQPAVAGILAGFFPVGVGAVYCGQYAKGLAHFGVATLLIVGVINATSATMATIFSLSMGAFYFYQLIDAIKSAKALQAGQPAPDPFGLGTMFSTGERHDFTRGVPTGALVLIGLGVLFLLHNLEIPFLEVNRIWPVLLIGLGLWLFAKRRVAPDGRYRSMTGPLILITIGALSLLDTMNGPGWNRTWPVILLVLGVMKLMERSTNMGGPSTPLPGPPPSPGSSQQQSSPEANTEVKNG
jgi:hypothetical protein